MNAFLLWTPRLLGAVTALFLALIALGEAASGQGFSGAGGVLIHLVPALTVAALVGVGWRYPVVGGLLLVALAVAPFVLLSSPPGVTALLAAPVFLCGLLFVVAAADRLRPATA